MPLEGDLSFQVIRVRCRGLCQRQLNMVGSFQHPDDNSYQGILANLGRLQEIEGELNG